LNDCSEIIFCTIILFVTKYSFALFIKNTRLPFEQCIACVYSHPISVKTLDEDIQNISFEAEFDIVTINILKRMIKAILEIYIDKYMQKNYNSLMFDCWFNMQYHDRKQLYKEDFHNHMNFMDPTVVPHKSFVYYIQMPNNLKGKDGVLFYKVGTEIYDSLPKENELYAMNSDLIHCPNSAFESTVDRIILGINVVCITPKSDHKYNSN